MAVSVCRNKRNWFQLTVGTGFKPAPEPLVGRDVRQRGGQANTHIQDLHRQVWAGGSDTTFVHPVEGLSAGRWLCAPVCEHITHLVCNGTRRGSYLLFEPLCGLCPNKRLNFKSPALIPPEKGYTWFCCFVTLSMWATENLFQSHLIWDVSG